MGMILVGVLVFTVTPLGAVTNGFVETIPLPPWLNDVPPPSTSIDEGSSQTASHTSISLRTDISIQAAKVPKPLRRGRIKEKIEVVQNLEDMRAFRDPVYFGVDPSRALWFSPVAFSRLLELHRPLPELLDFLGDAILNTTDAVNFEPFARALTHHYMFAPMGVDDYRRLVSACVERIANGVIDQLAVEHIVRSVPYMKVESMDSSNKDYLQDALFSIWSALGARRETGAIDLQPSAYAKFLSRVVSLGMGSQSLQLATEILRTSSSLHQMQFNTDEKRTLQRYTWLLMQHDQTTTRKTNDIATVLPEGVDEPMAIDLTLNAAPGAFARKWIETVTRTFTEIEFRERFLGDDYCRQVLIPWLAVLRSCTHLKQSLCDETWASVYSSLARAVKPKKLVSHFEALKDFSLTPVILLRHWFARDLKFATPFTPPKPEATHAHKLYINGKILIRKLPYKESLIFRNFRDENKRISLTGVVEERFSDRYAHYLADGQYLRRACMLALLDVLRPFLSEQRDCMEFWLELLLRRKPRQTFSEFANMAKRLKALHIDRGIIARYINYSCKMSPQAALWLLTEKKGQWVSASPDVPIKLITHSNVDPVLIFRLLRQRDPSAAVPLRHRPDHAKNCALSRGRVRLMHNLALAFAHSDRFTPKQAFRYVWQLYCYLSRARAPLGPDISRAMVHATVVRPMKAGQFLDLGVYPIVLALVKRLEGSEVANELDHMVWEHRKLREWNT